MIIHYFMRAVKRITPCFTDMTYGQTVAPYAMLYFRYARYLLINHYLHIVYYVCKRKSNVIFVDCIVKLAINVLTKYEQCVNIILYTHVNVNKLLTSIRLDGEERYERTY